MAAIPTSPQDLSKKDSALIKLGSELKELEEVAEKLDEKEQEVRAERRKVPMKFVAILFTMP